MEYGSFGGFVYDGSNVRYSSINLVWAIEYIYLDDVDFDHILIQSAFLEFGRSFEAVLILHTATVQKTGLWSEFSSSKTSMDEKSLL